jgi:hypothetical protein
MRSCSLRFIIGGALLILLGPMAPQAAAQNTLGGHFGVLFPLVTHGNDTTTDISEDFTIGFPMGITVRKSPTFAFDLEFVPSIQNEPLNVDLTVHPGVVWGLGDGWGAGIRMAFDVNKASWGFTPILNYGLLAVEGGGTIFAEVVVPIRFQEDSFGDGFTSIGLGVHVGVGF